MLVQLVVCYGGEGNFLGFLRLASESCRMLGSRAHVEVTCEKKYCRKIAQFELCGEMHFHSDFVDFFYKCNFTTASFLLTTDDDDDAFHLFLQKQKKSLRLYTQMGTPVLS